MAQRVQCGVTSSGASCSVLFQLCTLQFLTCYSAADTAARKKTWVCVHVSFHYQFNDGCVITEAYKLLHQHWYRTAPPVPGKKKKQEDRWTILGLLLLYRCWCRDFVTYCSGEYCSEYLRLQLWYKSSALSCCDVIFARNKTSAVNIKGSQVSGKEIAGVVLEMSFHQLFLNRSLVFLLKHS